MDHHRFGPFRDWCRVGQLGDVCWILLGSFLRRFVLLLKIEKDRIPSHIYSRQHVSSSQIMTHYNWHDLEASKRADRERKWLLVDESSHIGRIWDLIKTLAIACKLVPIATINSPRSSKYSTPSTCNCKWVQLESPIWRPSSKNAVVCGTVMTIVWLCWFISVESGAQVQIVSTLSHPFRLGTLSSIPICFGFGRTAITFLISARLFSYVDFPTGTWGYNLHLYMYHTVWWSWSAFLSPELC